jgi:hypothetical protein
LQEQSAEYYAASSRLETIKKFYENRSCSLDVVDEIGKFLKYYNSVYLKVQYFFSKLKLSKLNLIKIATINDQLESILTRITNNKQKNVQKKSFFNIIYNSFLCMIFLIIVAICIHLFVEDLYLVDFNFKQIKHDLFTEFEELLEILKLKIKY